MVLLSVTIRDYVINIVMTRECAHQDAHYQAAAVMIVIKDMLPFISPFEYRSIVKLTTTYPGGGGGVLRFGSDGGVPLKPPNPYLSLRVILAEKGTHY